jgi:hypothetical protein
MFETPFYLLPAPLDEESRANVVFFIYMVN